MFPECIQKWPVVDNTAESMLDLYTYICHLGVPLLLELRPLSGAREGGQKVGVQPVGGVTEELVVSLFNRGVCRGVALNGMLSTLCQQA